MLRKDYIQRQFEEFGKVLAQILGFKRNKDWERFESDVNAAAIKFTALEINAIENADDQGFRKMVLDNESLSQEQKTILATLLFEKMNFYIEQGDQRHYPLLKKRCQELYSHIKENFTENEFNLDVHYKLEFLSRMED